MDVPLSESIRSMGFRWNIHVQRREIWASKPTQTDLSGLHTHLWHFVCASFLAPASGQISKRLLEQLCTGQSVAGHRSQPGDAGSELTDIAPSRVRLGVEAEKVKNVHS